MSRTDQYIGLNQAAQKLVAGLVRVKSERGFETAWNGTWDLYNYVRAPIERQSHKCATCNETHEGPMPNIAKGEVAYREFVQAEPWSSGPMYFIALQRADGSKVQESLWSDEEMSDYSPY